MDYPGLPAKGYEWDTCRRFLITGRLDALRRSKSGRGGWARRGGAASSRRELSQPAPAAPGAGHRVTSTPGTWRAGPLGQKDRQPPQLGSIACNLAGRPLHAACHPHSRRRTAESFSRRWGRLGCRGECGRRRRLGGVGRRARCTAARGGGLSVQPGTRDVMGRRRSPASITPVLVLGPEELALLLVDRLIYAPCNE